MHANEIIQRLKEIDTELSPEWLTCDGELSRSQVRARYTKLITEKNRLEVKLGRPLTTKELYS